MQIRSFSSLMESYERLIARPNPANLPFSLIAPLFMAGLTPGRWLMKGVQPGAAVSPAVGPGGSVSPRYANSP